MTGKPKAAAVTALMRELRVLRRPHRDVIALQSQFVVALGHFAKFLAAEGRKDEALKIVGLAGAIGQLRNGTVADVLQPASFGGGRGPDGIVSWSLRHDVVKGLKCFLISRKFKTQEKAAKYIADKYPAVFDRLKRNSSASLATSILSWRRRIDDGDVPEAGDLLAHERRFFAQHGGENRSPAEMFALGERLLDQAAERTTKAVF